MSWARLSAEAPELAERIWAPFASERHAVLGTLRADGSPRLSGIEPYVVDGELYLGSMPDSYKIADLRRDPRFALHSASTQTRFEEAGDAKINGTAHPVTDDAQRSRYRAYLRAHIDFDPGEAFDLMRADVLDAMLLTTGDGLAYDLWHHERGVRRLHRG